MHIRAAQPEDAQAMAALRAASIRELCSADHHDDPAAIADWIGQPDKFVRLLERSDLHLVVAEIEGQLVGLGGVSGDTVTLNYVHPDYRFRGVSKGLMQAVEALLKGAGTVTGRLASSVTAVRFYHSIGWVDAGAFDADTGQPMIKRLQSASCRCTMSCQRSNL